MQFDALEGQKTPDHPFVAMVGNTNMIVRGPANERTVRNGPEVMYYKVNGADDLTHVEDCRDRFGYAVVGYGNLEQIAIRVPEKAPEVATLKHKLNGMINPPEFQRERMLAQLKQEGEAKQEKENESKAERVRVKKESA